MKLKWNTPRQAMMDILFLSCFLVLTSCTTAPEKTEECPSVPVCPAQGTAGQVISVVQGPITFWPEFVLGVRELNSAQRKLALTELRQSYIKERNLEQAIKLVVLLLHDTEAATNDLVFASELMERIIIDPTVDDVSQAWLRVLYVDLQQRLEDRSLLGQQVQEMTEKDKNIKNLTLKIKELTSIERAISDRENTSGSQ